MTGYNSEEILVCVCLCVCVCVCVRERETDRQTDKVIEIETER